MSYIDKIKHYGKKTITKEKLGDLLGSSDDSDMFTILKELEKNKLIQPVKSSKTNGNQRYPIYLKYKITLPEENFNEERVEIMKLHPALQNTGYWMQKPAEYRKYRSQIQALDRYLFDAKERSIPVSRKERSFEIFAEEKQLEDVNFCRILERIGLDQVTLAYYDTPEYCFNDYIPERKKGMTLLICENKDIWFNVRRRMFEDQASCIFGQRIDGVVYGSGNRVTEENALTVYTKFMGGAEVRYLYWGDIDRAGLSIYLALCRNNPELHIQLFVPAYDEMLKLASARQIPDSEDNRILSDCYDDVISLFAPEYQEKLRAYLSENKRIPQEIIPYTYLIEAMR